jgi:hypothetical protein
LSASLFLPSKAEAAGQTHHASHGIFRKTQPRITPINADGLGDYEVEAREARQLEVRLKRVRVTQVGVAACNNIWLGQD